MSKKLNGKRVIEEDLPIVKRIAGKIRINIPQAEFDDMFQDGCIGLLGAYNDWDVNLGASFETFAGIRIRGEIIDGLRRLQWQSRSYSRGKRRVARARRNVESRLLRKATPKEVAEEMGVPISEYFRITDGHYRQMIPLNLRVDEDNVAHPVVEMQGSSPGIDIQMILKEDQLLVDAALAKIKGRRRLVLDMFVDDDLTEAAIGAVLGISESRVCQILKDAVEKLKIEVELLKNAELRNLFAQLEEKYQSA